LLISEIEVARGDDTLGWLPSLFKSGAMAAATMAGSCNPEEASGMTREGSRCSIPSSISGISGVTLCLSASGMLVSDSFTSSGVSFSGALSMGNGTFCIASSLTVSETEASPF
jgi:hypothetical protein